MRERVAGVDLMERLLARAGQLAIGPTFRVPVSRSSGPLRSALPLSTQGGNRRLA